MTSSEGPGGAAPIDRFVLLEKIGRGGMGVVWKARDEETGAIVALKVLNAAYADQPDYVTRFERELELAKRIHSDHVVQVLGYGVRDGTPYLVLQLIDGPSIRQRLTDHGPYTWDETRALLVQIATGLRDAHAAGVIHRDVKPSNVLVGSDGVARLADFGIAKGVDLTRVTGTSTLLGTPAYLPPEGAKDARSDLYSLGIVAFELMAGAPPFDGDTFSDVMLAHLRTPPDLAKLPEAARPVVGWLLAKDPNARPQSAAQLLAALEGKVAAPPMAAAVTTSAAAYGASSELPTLPLPRGFRAHDGRPERSRRRRVVAGFLVGAIMVVLAAGAVWGASAGAGQGPSPTSSGFLAAGGVGQPSGLSSSLAPSGFSGPTDTEAASPSPSGSAGGIAAAGASVAATTTPAQTPTPAAPTPAAAKQTPTPTVKPSPPTLPPYTPTPVVPPAAPSGVTASVQGMTSIWVGWSDNSNNETGFTLNDNSSNTVALPAGTTSYTWTVSAGTSKCFEVSANNSAGSSAWTSWVCAGPTPTPTPTPTPCYKSGAGAGVTFYQGQNYGGSSYGPVYAAAGSEAKVNLPWQAYSFNDPSGAWHVVVFENANQGGNMAHYDNSQPNLSSSRTLSATVYIAGC